MTWAEGGSKSVKDVMDSLAAWMKFALRLEERKLALLKVSLFTSC